MHIIIQDTPVQFKSFNLFLPIVFRHPALIVKTVYMYMYIA